MKYINYWNGGKMEVKNTMTKRQGYKKKTEI